MAMTKRLWSINALAVELDVDRRTVANALKKVAPDGEQAGHPAWFILTAIRAMWPAPDADGEILDPAQERARKDRALAIQAEIRNDTALGNVVLVDDVVMTVGNMFANCRQRLLSLPSKITMHVPAQYQGAVFERAEEVVHDTLNELADAELVEPVQEARKKQAGQTKRGLRPAEEHSRGDLEGRSGVDGQSRTRRRTPSNRRAAAGAAERDGGKAFADRATASRGSASGSIGAGAAGVRPLHDKARP